MLRRLSPARLRQRVGSRLAEGFFRGLSTVGRLHPLSRLDRHGVEAVEDLAYCDDGRAEHRLDVYRPTSSAPPWPVVLYVHGGGFRILSKETHWLMGLVFARRGYLVCNINYSLAPRYPFPQAVEDTCAALAWVAGNAERFGGDPRRLVFAGESAGANLVTALTLATCFRRAEPFARQVFDLELTPGAVLPTCGMFQVSDPERFGRRRPLSAFINDRIVEASRAYLPRPTEHGATLDLADPLTVLERGDPPDRPLPPFYVAVGTKDPLLDDTRRLAAALQGRGVPCTARYFPGEMHAFHALVWRRQARQCWREQFEFLETHLPPPAGNDPRGNHGGDTR
ncbi:MAG: alpha/beta hydrolase [bacterium]